MSIHAARPAWLGYLALFAAGALACSAPFFGPPATSTPAPTATPLPATATPLPSATASSTPLPSATPALDVFISADGGNLNIRRGPGPEYNVVGFLTNGSRSKAIGRNPTGNWLYSEIPSNPGTYGWVSADSTYSAVEGPASDLPLTPYDAASPAYLRNCTFHPMLIQPAGFILKEQFDSPNNRRQVNPGHYEAWDQSEVIANPVLEVDIREGDSVDINFDGFHNAYYCP